MAWGYSTQMYNSARIPRITGYEFMRDHFKSVVPIRGREVQCKPLGANRRFTWFEVVENTNCYMSEDEPLGRIEMSYACKFGNANMVEFFRDGSIVIRDNHWHGATAMGFLTHSLREFGDIRSANGAKWYFVNKQGNAYLLSRDGLRIVRNDEGIYVPTNPIQEFTYSAKRKVLNKLRKNYKDFIEYGKTMLAMDSRITMDTGDALGFLSKSLIGTPNYWSSRKDAENRAIAMGYLDKIKETNDLDLTYSLAQFMASAFGGYTYYSKGYECSPTAFVKGFTELLKYQFADEAFEAKPVELGELFSDRNQKYVSSK